MKGLNQGASRGGTTSKDIFCERIDEQIYDAWFVREGQTGMDPVTFRLRKFMLLLKHIHQFFTPGQEPDFDIPNPLCTLKFGGPKFDEEYTRKGGPLLVDQDPTMLDIQQGEQMGVKVDAEVK